MRTLLKLLLCIVLLQGVVSASSADFGPPVDGEIVSAHLTTPSSGAWTLKVRLLQSCKGPGIHETKAGSVVSITHNDKRASFKKGDKIKVQWMNYSAMTPNGAISGSSWKLAI